MPRLQYRRRAKAHESAERARRILLDEAELLDALAWRLQTVGSFP
jgi:hypothetical protein